MIQIQSKHFTEKRKDVINCLFNQSAASPQNACMIFNSGGAATDPAECINDGKNKFSTEEYIALDKKLEPIEEELFDSNWTGTHA